MKRTLILLSVLAVFAAIQLFTADSALTSTACPVGCSSTVILNTACSNCSGTWCGPDGSHSFTTNASGEFMMSCRCAGTYYFCVGGQTYSVTVDGSLNTYYPVQGGLCPCRDE